MLILKQNARVILTDSGGMQEEAYFLDVPCFTLRPENKWVERVAAGWNVLAGANKEDMLNAVTSFLTPPDNRPPLYGDGAASPKDHPYTPSRLRRTRRNIFED